MRVAGMFRTMLQDLRYGLRGMSKTPGFFAVAIATLAVGIGANTAMFSVVNAVLLRPLPYEDPGRLVLLRENNPLLGMAGGERFGVSWPNFSDWRERSHSFESLAAIYTTQVTVSDQRAGEAERVPAALVSPELFGVLRARPALGRGFTPEEDRPGSVQAVIVSDGLWKRRFGGRPEALGGSIDVNGETHTVVGIMPAGFTFRQDDIQLWMPLGTITPQLANRSVHVLAAVGRLAGGATIGQAGTELSAISSALQLERPGEDPGHGAVVEPLSEQVVSAIRPALLVLAGAVGFVLLIACGNIANLLLARTASRRREIAIRAALGASRGRILRQMLTESVLLAALGGSLGLLIALWGTDLLASGLPELVPRRGTISIDATVLGFTLFVSLLTGILFGLAPALDACRLDLAGSMKRGAAGGAGGGLREGLTGSLRSIMVIAQVALSLVLLAGAGLMIRSFWRLQSVDPGFDTSGLLIMNVSIPTRKYDDPGKVIAFYRELQHSLELVPGATAASAVSSLPISGGDGQGDLTIEGRPFPPGEAPGASFRRVLPSYFRVMGIPLVSGREFDDRDDGGQKVVIINESMARRFWPGVDPTGQRIKVGPPEGEPWLTIVGVVGDVLNVGLDAQPGFATYEPHAQRPWSTMTLALRTGGDPMALAAPAREVIRRAEPAAPVFSVTTMDGRITESLALRRFNTTVMRLFSAVALLLAAVGIYGVLAYSVSRRTAEFGIRMALGASGNDLVRLVVGQGMSLVSIGVGIGVAAAFGLTRLLSTLLFGVSATDPATFAAVALLMSLVALVSCYLPARRASRVDPMTALRNE